MDIFAKEVLKDIDASPTAFHVIKNAADYLDAAGFMALEETEIWKLEGGGKYYVTRSGSSLIAFTIPKADFKGFRIMAGHSDSPCLKIKENPEIRSDGYIRLNVEKYGGMILAPWFDRPLTAAGRLLVKDKSGIRTILINVDRDIAVIPSLAIHMNRDINNGYKYSVQNDMLPVYDSSDSKKSFMSMIAETAGVSEENIMGSDIYLVLREKGVIWGAENQFVASSRLDDQECVWASLKGFLQAEINPEYAGMLCIFDNEEVGSRTRQGADSDFLNNLINRINDNLGRTREQYYTALAESFMISADNAHAVHPAHREKYDPVQQPHINEGIVLKFSARQSYTTDGITGARVRGICEDNDIPLQIFVNHSDEPGGSTLGNFSNGHVSIETADIGLPQLAMHSAYETAGVKDLEWMKKFVKAFYSDIF